MARGVGTTWPFLAGVAAGTALAAAWSATPRVRRPPLLDERLIRSIPRGERPAMVVFVPGILGSQLLRPDGSVAWLNLGNTLGHHDLRLPARLPFTASRDELHPGLMIGTDDLLPRAFGFTEYADFLDLMDAAGFEPGLGPGHRYAVHTYDWRRDIVESARGLARRLEALADSVGDENARFHLVGHSMGGLVVRYYLRFGGSEPRPGEPVRWLGARRTASVVQVATPNAGSVASLGAVVSGERVGFSYTTLAAAVVRRMPSIYQLLPPAGTRPLVDARGRFLDADLHDVATWERLGWGPFGPEPEPGADVLTERRFVRAALARARAVHEALARPAALPCPVPVHAVGGDCLLTAARALLDDGPPGTPPRLEARTTREQDWIFEAGDGRVTRASVLGSHLATVYPSGSGYPETTHASFGGGDHHGVYADPSSQNLLLRLVLRPAPPARAVAAGA
jgi:hypothetical protein